MFELIKQHPVEFIVGAILFVILTLIIIKVGDTLSVKK